MYHALPRCLRTAPSLRSDTWDSRPVTFGKTPVGFRKMSQICFRFEVCIKHTLKLWKFMQLCYFTFDEHWFLTTPTSQVPGLAPGLPKGFHSAKRPLQTLPRKRIRLKWNGPILHMKKHGKNWKRLKTKVSARALVAHASKNVHVEALDVLSSKGKRIELWMTSGSEWPLQTLGFSVTTKRG